MFGHNLTMNATEIFFVFSRRAPTGCHCEKGDRAHLIPPGLPGRRRMVPRLAAAGIQDCQPLHAADAQARGSRPERPAEYGAEPSYNPHWYKL